MVVALGPGKFYGSGLPRPRFYTDVKFAPDRVDPPAPVMDPFLSWAHEAHWSMGGLSVKRLRLQGRIEGNVNKLRAQRRRSDRVKKSKIRSEDDNIRKLDQTEWPESQTDSEPEPEPEKELVPMVKEGNRTGLRSRSKKPESDKAGEGGEAQPTPRPRKRARKLVDDFERAAEADGTGSRSRSKKPESDKGGEAGGASHRRTSPRKSVAV